MRSGLRFRKLADPGSEKAALRVLSAGSGWTCGRSAVPSEPREIERGVVRLQHEAVAVGMRFGVEPARITSALESYVPSNSRSELRQTDRNTLIVDAYNANPTSMKAALDNFALIPHPHKMVILGDMRELGEASAEEHRRVAARAGALGCEAVWLVGPEFASCELPCSRHFASVDEVKAAIAGGERPEGRLILIKGSNGTHLFELPDLL